MHEYQIEEQVHAIDMDQSINVIEHATFPEGSGYIHNFPWLQRVF